jgi:hypothetical protein
MGSPLRAARHGVSNETPRRGNRVSGARNWIADARSAILAAKGREATSMNVMTRIFLLSTLCGSLAACASKPPEATSAATPSPAPAPATTPAEEKASPIGQKKYKWSRATEDEVAAALDRKFADAAKYFVQLKRNDQLMFCKKYKEMGSSIRTLHCITEAELRKQVEDSEELRSQMRNRVGKCTLGQKVACSGQ